MEQMMLIALALVLWVAIYVVAMAMARMAALSDAAARRMFRAQFGGREPVKLADHRPPADASHDAPRAA
jgi:hypothetical protein